MLGPRCDPFPLGISLRGLQVVFNFLAPKYRATGGTSMAVLRQAGAVPPLLYNRYALMHSFGVRPALA